MAYPWKDNIHICHLAHIFSESNHQCSCGSFLKKEATTGWPHVTGKSFDFKSYRAIPKKYLVLTLGLDTKGYFLGGENFF